MFLLMFFDQGRKGKFLETTTHSALDPGQVDSLPIVVDDLMAVEVSGLLVSVIRANSRIIGRISKIRA